jgi:hypothetical protein
MVGRYEGAFPPSLSFATGAGAISGNRLRDCGLREPRAVRADFLVERRGFEPLTSALGARGDCGAASVLQGVLSKARRWIPP